MMSMFIWNRKRMRRVTFNVTNQMMKWAPLGVFALIGVTVSKFGLSSLSPLGKIGHFSIWHDGFLCYCCTRDDSEVGWLQHI